MMPIRKKECLRLQAVDRCRSCSLRDGKTCKQSVKELGLWSDPQQKASLFIVEPVSQRKYSKGRAEEKVEEALLGSSTAVIWPRGSTMSAAGSCGTWG